MNKTQHVFRSGRSTFSQLLRYYDSILTKLEKGSIVGPIHFDFANAFDKVDHNILLLKAQNLNIEGKWTESFLKRRK